MREEVDQSNASRSMSVRLGIENMRANKGKHIEPKKALGITSYKLVGR